MLSQGDNNDIDDLLHSMITNAYKTLVHSIELHNTNSMLTGTDTDTDWLVVNHSSLNLESSDRIEYFDGRSQFYLQY